MAGTDRKQQATAPGGPAIVLVEPQLGENIGMVARAMLNCGLVDLRLVNPRDGWPNPDAIDPSSGATVVLDGAKVFSSTEEAIADLDLVFATTARPRGMTKDVYTPRAAAEEMRKKPHGGTTCGILFGKEAKGLKNDDVALADNIVTVPLNPAFTSLNLAQCVLLLGYEWYQSADRTAPSELVTNDSPPASKQSLQGLFDHLESELDTSGFLRVEEKRPIMVRNLRNMWHRARLTEQEVRTWRGIIKALTKWRDGVKKP